MLMKKRFAALQAALLMTALFSSCSAPRAAAPVLSQSAKPQAAGGPEQKPPYEQFSAQAPQDTLLVIVNQPDERQLDSVNITESRVVDSQGVQMLLVPKHAGTDLSIESVEYQDGVFVTRELFYEKEDTPEEFVLSLTAVRPEGIPFLRIEAAWQDQASEYILSYNGKDGTPNFEYLTKTTYGASDIFLARETAAVFTMDEGALAGLLGQPTQKLESGPRLSELHFGDDVFYIRYDKAGEGRVYQATLTSGAIPAPRDVAVGDSLDGLLARFAGEAGGERKAFGTESCLLLYGDPASDSQYGMILYSGDSVSRVVYSDRGTSVSFEIAGGRVTAVQYRITP